MLQQLIISFPNKHWNWSKLSHNKNINNNIVEKFINKPWNFSQLSHNNTIDCNFIKKYSHKNWDWTYIFRYKYIDIDFIETIKLNSNELPRLDIININWKNISMNKNIRMNFIKKYESYLDLWSLAYYNPNLSKEFILQNIEKKIYNNNNLNNYTNNYEKFWKPLSKSENSSLTFDIIRDNPTIPWDYYRLTTIIDIPIEFIKDNIDKEFDWYHLSLHTDIDTIFENLHLPWEMIYISKNNKLREHHILKYIDKITWDWNSLFLNGNISVDFILENKYENYNIEYSLIYESLTTKYIEKNINKSYWDFNRLSNNPKLTFNIVKNNLDKEWNWNKLSKYLKINIEDVVNNITFPWNWTKLSKNTYLTIGMICIDKYPNLPWNWSDLSENPNITVEFVKKYSNYNNIDYIDWNKLSNNLFKNHPKLIIMEESVSVIKNMWRILSAKRELKRRKMNYIIKYKAPCNNFLGGIEYIKHKELFEELINI